MKMTKINSRAKGKSAEREVIGELKRLLPPELTNDLERNLEQTRNGGYDIVGLKGWAPEVKRYAKILPADLDSFWEQTVTQARNECKRPALFMREDRREWRVRVALCDLSNTFEMHDIALQWTAEISMEAFADLVKATV
jgi:hypothetical protein